MSTNPKISVVIATWNRAAYLKRMLDRLFEDDYPNLEVIVADGGSQDGTVDVLKSYGNRITFWLSEPDTGEFNAYNKVIPRATGEIVKIMTDDDTLRPGALRLAANFFASNPDIDIMFAQAAIWEERDGDARFLYETNITDPNRLSLQSWLRGTEGVSSPTAFVRRSVFDSIGLLPEDCACGDIEFWTRAAYSGLRMGLIPDVIFDYYFTGQNGTFTRGRALIDDRLTFVRRYGSRKDVLCVRASHAVGSISKKLGFRPLRWLRMWRSRRGFRCQVSGVRG